jgi:hypothetical protein
MIDFSNVSIAILAIHRVGNKIRDEGFVMAKSLYPVTKEIEPHLLDYFLKPLASAEVFQFSHTSNLKLNELYQFSVEVFSQREKFLDESVNALKHLYQCSVHPKIKPGDVYFVYLNGIKFNGESLDAIGIFKSETKDLFIQISETTPRSFDLKIEKGANLKNLDKGCIILNTEANDGYRMLLIDNNHDNTQFWRDKFLNVKPAHDAHFYTSACLDMCQKFSVQAFSEEGARKNQILFLKKSVEYLSNHDKFDVNNFSKEVFKDKASATTFKSFKNTYESEASLPKLDSFIVSKQTIKKIKRRFKDFIKLDTKIEVKLKFDQADSNAENIERGYDQTRKMYFYKLYFNKEI